MENNINNGKVKIQVSEIIAKCKIKRRLDEFRKGIG